MNEHEKALPAGGPAKYAKCGENLCDLLPRATASAAGLLLLSSAGEHAALERPHRGTDRLRLRLVRPAGALPRPPPAEHLGEPRSAGGESGPGRHAGPGVQLVFPGVESTGPAGPVTCPRHRPLRRTVSALVASLHAVGAALFAAVGPLRPSGGSIGHRLASEKGRRRPAGPAPAAGRRPAPWRCWRSWCPFWPPPTRCSPPPRRTCGPLSPSTSRTRSGRPCWPAS